MMRGLLNNKKFVRLLPIIILIIVMLACTTGYYLTRNKDWFLPYILLYLKQAFGIYAYERRYTPENEPDDPWIRVKYTMFKFF